MHPEEEDQVQTQPEAGRREPEGRERHDRLINPGIAMRGRGDTRRYADQDLDQHRQECEQERRLQPLPDRERDGNRHEDRLSEVPMKNPDEPTLELHVDGFIESQHFSEVVDLLL